MEKKYLKKVWDGTDWIVMDQGGGEVGEHKHPTSDITNFPSSMPASDVYAWAKASAKPAYTAAEVSAMPLVGGTFTGAAIAQTNANYTTRQLRNVISATTAPAGGANGDVWIRYT